MSIVVKAGAGLVTGVVAGALGLVLLPRLEPNAVHPRSSVEKPQFVVAYAPAPQPSATLAVATDTPVAKPSATALPPAEKLVLRPGVTPVAPPSPDPASKPDTPAAPAPSQLAVAAPAPAATAPASAKPAVVAAAAPSVSDAPVASAPLKSASDDAARWSVLGLVALAKGDLSTARLFLSRATEAGDARAWVALADTYDPAMLAKLGVVFAPGDAQRARDCLVKAMAAGVVVPKDRLAALDTATQQLH